MYRIAIHDMDLAQIAASGQCFRMKAQEDGSWLVRTKDKKVSVRQEESQFVFSCDGDEFEAVWRTYFDLGTDYGTIKALVDRKDGYLSEAVRYGNGIRVLNQDLWEMVVTFLISQNNNIPRIRKSVELLCDTYGEDGSFPNVQTVAAAGVDGLSGLGLGYRDKYISRAAQDIMDDRFDLEAVKRADYETAHAMLLEQYGIGKKVADCICLFALHHVDAFPVDTHIKKLLEVNYPDGFEYERYRGYLGIVQQYMFYYDLKK